MPLSLTPTSSTFNRKSTNKMTNHHQEPQKAITKVRRTRQPKNPQLSVARRNERERNRVKMVNNGFALLREHLPIEDLMQVQQDNNFQDSQSIGSDTPDIQSTKGASSKTKKYSKVETLRAAIQRIKMLEELIRQTEPTFQSINLVPSGNNRIISDDCEEPSSSASYSGDADNLSVASTMHQIHSPSQSSQQQPQQQQLGQRHLYATNQQGQFIKLEPVSGNNQAANISSNQLPSPQDSQMSHSSTVLSSYSPPASQSTNQVHFINHHHQQPASSVSSQLFGQQKQPSHTHLWIQQHQSSFMEQQQLSAADQWANNYNQYQVESPEMLAAQQPSSTQQIQQQPQHHPEEPLATWFGAASAEQQANQQLQQQQHQQHQLQQQQQQQQSPLSQPANFHQLHHHHHQISLYSQ